MPLSRRSTLKLAGLAGVTRITGTSEAQAGELAILEPLRGKIPDEVFTTPCANPVNSDPLKRRKNMCSANTMGIRDAAIDQIVGMLVLAPYRSARVAACQALDRVLIWHHFVVRMFFTPSTRVFRRNRFGHPDTMPARAPGFPDIWWWDEANAKVIAK